MARAQFVTKSGFPATGSPSTPGSVSVGVVSVGSGVRGLGLRGLGLGRLGVRFGSRGDRSRDRSRSRRHLLVAAAAGDRESGDESEDREEQHGATAHGDDPIHAAAPQEGRRRTSFWSAPGHVAESVLCTPRSLKASERSRDPFGERHDARVHDEQDHLLAEAARDPEGEADLDQPDDELHPPQLELVLGHESDRDVEDPFEEEEEPDNRGEGLEGRPRSRPT